jgi:hypothetical protein
LPGAFGVSVCVLIPPRGIAETILGSAEQRYDRYLKDRKKEEEGRS